MLVNFCLENFKSFKGMEEFTMIASDNPEGSASEFLCYEDDRVILAGDPECRIVPVSAIFGANSYGKSTFVQALLLIQRLVLDPAKEGAKIAVSPFFMDPEAKKLPTSFELNILSEGTEYEIFIKLSKNRIIEERVSVVKGESVEDMYCRKEKIAVNQKFNRDEKIKLAFESSRSNTLLLSNKTLHEMSEFKPIYNWFNETLVIVSADTRFVYANDADALTTRIGEAIRRLDTGVETIKTTPAKLSRARLSQNQIKELKKGMESKEAAYFMTRGHDMFMAQSAGGEIFLSSIDIVKKDCMKNMFSVKSSEESNGTHQLLRLLPAVLQLGDPGQSKVVIIDDLDKSLHVEMTWGLVEYHLNSLDLGGNSQLIFTTHGVDLIDNCLLRNDEVWIIRKSHSGVSDLTCLSQFEGIESDMTFRQLYKSNSLGGSPRIHLTSSHQLQAKSSDLCI